ncbi:MAG: amidohydrolase family protein [Conexivisphaerales archaeon]
MPIRRITENIDTHLHLSTRKDDKLLPFAKRNGLHYDLQELSSIMERNNTSAGLLLSPPVSFWRPCPNEEILELAQASKGLLHPVLTVEGREASVLSALKLAEDHKKEVKGFKILLGYERIFPTDNIFKPLYDYCEERNLPVLFHTGDTADSRGSLLHSHPLNLDALANSRPNLKIVACHFGNPWLMDTAELLYKHENLYADISGLFTGGEGEYSSKYLQFLAKTISNAIYYIGNCDKILFGSDYPISLPGRVLQLVMNLEISSRDARKILFKNSKILFRI